MKSLRELPSRAPGGFGKGVGRGGRKKPKGSRAPQSAIASSPLQSPVRFQPIMSAHTFPRGASRALFHRVRIPLLPCLCGVRQRLPRSPLPSEADQPPILSGSVSTRARERRRSQARPLPPSKFLSGPPNIPGSFRQKQKMLLPKAAPSLRYSGRAFHVWDQPNTRAVAPARLMMRTAENCWTVRPSAQADAKCRPLLDRLSLPSARSLHGWGGLTSLPAARGCLLAFFAHPLSTPFLPKRPRARYK